MGARQTKTRRGGCVCWQVTCSIMWGVADESSVEMGQGELVLVMEMEIVQ
jgi:hypothetical protein